MRKIYLWCIVSGLLFSVITRAYFVKIKERTCYGKLRLNEKKLQTEESLLKKRLFHVTTIDGLEDVLAWEVKEKVPDATNIQVQRKGVTFVGTSRSGLESLLWLRTALKVMERIQFPANLGNNKNNRKFVHDKEELYDLASSVDWVSMITPEQTLKCDSTISSTTSPTLTHSHFTALTVKNTIIDQFRNYYHDGNLRPSIDLEYPILPILLYLHRNEVFLYRVWSGEQSMHKRGYRSDSIIHKASLRETTAAGLVFLSDWDPLSSYLFDPMCGSGTIAIEAALIAANTAPGLFKYSKDIYLPVPLQWKDIQEETDCQQLWKQVYEQALAKDNRLKYCKPIIFANDMENKAIQLAERAAAHAGVRHMISFSNQDIIDYYLPITIQEPFSMITNPPWNHRLEVVDNSWKKLNDFIDDSRNRLQTVSILNGNPSLFRYITVKPIKEYHLNAAKMPLSFISYRP